MRTGTKSKPRLVAEIVERLARRHSTASILLHQAVAQRLGLGPTDHKCFDLLRERGATTAGELAAVTGLTSGAMTGVVARLERAGFVRREADPGDGRRQILRARGRRSEDVHDVLDPLRKDVASLLESLDVRQLAGIAAFLAGSTDLAYRHIALLRSEGLRTSGTGQPVNATRSDTRSGGRREPRSERPPRRPKPDPMARGRGGAKER